MNELLEKYKISYLETSDGRIYMIHENVLTDLVNEHRKQQLSVCDVVNCKHDFQRVARGGEWEDLT